MVGVEKLELVKGGAEAAAAVAVVVGSEFSLEGGLGEAGFGAARWGVACGWRRRSRWRRGGLKAGWADCEQNGVL